MNVQLDMPRQFRRCPFRDTDTTCNFLTLLVTLGKLPGGKLAQVSDVSAAVVYLASEGAGMVNCHTLMVDGGWTAW